MPLITLDTLPVREIFPGLRARLVHTDRVSHSWVEIDEGATFPEHRHPHEQIVSVIEGTLELIVAGTPHLLTPGRVFVIPPDVPHAGRAHTACRVLDTFAPVREDYK
jgi:quercetin dioxygenase-like cupin family protein